MGYTHYWNNDEFTASEWQELLLAAAAVFASVRGKHIAIAGWDGKDKPTITLDRISFNGRAPNDFETCAINRTGDKFTFCKTGRRPYDLAVVALLVCASKIGPLQWSSDGDEEETREGRELAARVLENLPEMRLCKEAT